MAISLVGTGSDTDNAGNATSVSLPVGTAQNDVVYAVHCYGATSDLGVSTNTTGYTELTELYADDNEDANAGYYRKVQGATPDSTFAGTGSGDSTFGAASAVMVLRGVDTTTPEDATTTTATGIDTGAANCAAIDTASANAWVLAMGGSTHSSTFASITGYSDLVSTGLNDTVDACVGIAWKLIASPATENPPAFALTGGSSTNDSWTAATVAVKAAVASIVIDAASYTFTGQNVTFNKGYSVVVGAASYAFTGQDVTFNKGLTVSLDPVSYAFTGQDVSLEHDWQVGIDAASYTFTGQAVSVEHGWQVDVGAASYTFTAQDVTFTLSGGALSIDLDPVSYAFSGQDTSTEWGRQVAVGATSYSFTAADITLALSTAEAARAEVWWPILPKQPQEQPKPKRKRKKRKKKPESPPITTLDGRPLLGVTVPEPERFEIDATENDGLILAEMAAAWHRRLEEQAIEEYWRLRMEDDDWLMMS